MFPSHRHMKEIVRKLFEEKMSVCLWQIKRMSHCIGEVAEQLGALVTLAGDQGLVSSNVAAYNCYSSSGELQGSCAASDFRGLLYHVVHIHTLSTYMQNKTYKYLQEKRLSNSNSLPSFLILGLSWSLELGMTCSHHYTYAPIKCSSVLLFLLPPIL